MNSKAHFAGPTLVVDNGKDEDNSRIGGSGGGDDGDMERRIAKLEDKLETLQVTLTSIQVTLATVATKNDVKNVEVELAGIKGKIDNIPTTAKVAAIIAIVGALLKLVPWLTR
ncbi:MULTISPECIES: hypothetical protein [Acetobacter]|uniref:Uncharacterized protein n=2 Tax=Acetobacter TaxID=434 RepID=A0AAN1PFC4_9PROT|nr:MULTISPECIES: hypothetical protein [Acetobacter]ASL41516.1 hypothetical protein CBI36_14755 [Acetobacter oryzifermentans]AXM99162.1 hypothetical protein CJF59_00180 [Acetobacter pomorum]KAA8395637.1 hypothetical protein FKW19_10075 [Acetobacter sp. DmW_125128]KAA8396691.1 hypothetical protein FKW22_05730 [Acetobacter sp. DmW_125124]KAA8400435.1 hypothetical protein FKW20_02120 [Acetobacter sp. DmW_125127]